MSLKFSYDLRRTGTTQKNRAFQNHGNDTKLLVWTIEDHQGLTATILHSGRKRLSNQMFGFNSVFQVNVGRHLGMPKPERSL